MLMITRFEQERNATFGNTDNYKTRLFNGLSISLPELFTQNLKTDYQ